MVLPRRNRTPILAIPVPYQQGHHVFYNIPQEIPSTFQIHERFIIPTSFLPPFLKGHLSAAEPVPKRAINISPPDPEELKTYPIIKGLLAAAGSAVQRRTHQMRRITQRSSPNYCPCHGAHLKPSLDREELSRRLLGLVKRVLDFLSRRQFVSNN